MTIFDMKPSEPDIKLLNVWRWIPPFFDSLMSAPEEDDAGDA